MSKSYMVLVSKLVQQEHLERISRVIFGFEYVTPKQIEESVLLDLEVVYGLRERQEQSGEEIVIFRMEEFAGLQNNGAAFDDYWLVPVEVGLTLSRKTTIPYGTKFAKSFLRSIAPEYLQTLTNAKKMDLWNYYMRGVGKIWYKTSISQVLKEICWMPYDHDYLKDEHDNPLYTWYDGRTLRRVESFYDTPWCNAEATDWIVEQDDVLFLLWAENAYGKGKRNNAGASNE